MPRGRQYYDPIIQMPGKVEVEEQIGRIEVYMDESLKWQARRIAPNGSIAEVGVGDFDHDRLIQIAKERWPGLEVYELRNETDDSTWEGIGPSPRLWQTSGALAAAEASRIETSLKLEREDVPPAGDFEQVQLRVLPITEPGSYALISDIRELLLAWAAQYEEEKNPSAAMALREAAQALEGV